MQLFYGTGNSSKLRNMRAMLVGMPIEFVTSVNLGIALPHVDEIGNTPLDNARLKAQAYYRETGLPSFALDSGLYLEGLPAEEQPGPYVRRVAGRELLDKEFLSYYQTLAHQHGGKIRAQFVNGLCVVLDETHQKEAFGPQVSTNWFWIVEKAHPDRLDGFPMDSIAVDPETGLYWVESDRRDEQNAKGSGLAAGVRKFFSELLDGNLSNCVKESSGR